MKTSVGIWSEDKKVFISAPIRGKTYDDIIAEINYYLPKIKDYVHRHYDSGVKLIKSVMKNPSENEIQCLADSIKHMSKADLVVFLPGWDKARGCKVEHLIAECYDIDRLYMNE